MSEHMTDERVEEIRSWMLNEFDMSKPGDMVGELLAEVDRLRATHEPPAVTVVPAWGGGTHDLATGTLRVTLAAWLKYGPQWARGGLVRRVELIDREPRETHLGSDPKGPPGYWWLAHDITTPERLPREWFNAGHNGVRFPTREDARDWASERALAWAKEQPE